MASNKEKTYWPHMILGFLFIAIILGYWTIKSAINMPVQESNEYLLKYQTADNNINSILEAKERFDAKYAMAPIGFTESDFKPNTFDKRKHGVIIALAKSNQFAYELKTKAGEPVNDAKVSFLLTRPHSVRDDQRFEALKAENGRYSTPEITLEKPGRYILRLRVQIGDTVGFIEHEAYLKPE